MLSAPHHDVEPKHKFGAAAAGGGMDIGSIVGQIAGGGVGGAVVMVIVGII